MNGIFDEFSGSLTADVLTFNSDTIPAPDTLYFRMTRGERKIANEMRKAFGGFRRVVIDVDGEQREFGADSLIQMLESYESYRQVPEQGEHDDGGERESCGEVCGDDRFELIGKAKAKLLEATNIEMRADEMAVIDSVLFRCWQMGWLDQLRENRYSELFGTPERAARTLSPDDMSCRWCLLHAHCKDECLIEERGRLLEWLRGDAE